MIRSRSGLMLAASRLDFWRTHRVSIAAIRECERVRVPRTNLVVLDGARDVQDRRGDELARHRHGHRDVIIAMLEPSQQRE